MARERENPLEGMNLPKEDTVTFTTGNVQLKGRVCTEFVLLLVPQEYGNAGCYCKAIGKLSGTHTLAAVAYRGGWGGLGVSKLPRDSEGPPKSCQAQRDCEKC